MSLLPPLKNPASGKRILLGALVVAYLLTAGYALKMAWLAHVPCKENFEGGCSLGKAYLFFFSLFLSVVAAGIAAVTSGTIFGIWGLKSRKRGYAVAAAGLMVGAPLIYLAYALVLLYRAFAR